VFENDFPALTSEDTGPIEPDTSGLLVARADRGICRVICFTPRHNAALPDLSPLEARAVIDTWSDQYAELGAQRWITHVQIFENRGAAVGASNPHPHCQVWANAEVPVIPAREGTSQLAYLLSTKRCLLCDYLAVERERRDRVVWSNDGFTALVPYWAVWPYEMLLLPHRHVTGLDAFDDSERSAFAEAVQTIVRAYDRLFDAECPYSMGIHQRPTDAAPHDAWHLHAHYYPPVLRSASVHKFMVGYELLAMPQRDLTPELAAAALREAL
jgi:UDPglucose--hexose-1-phosphate uridylyltransferase